MARRKTQTRRSVHRIHADLARLEANFHARRMLAARAPLDADEAFDSKKVERALRQYAKARSAAQSQLDKLIGHSLPVHACCCCCPTTASGGGKQQWVLDASRFSFRVYSKEGYVNAHQSGAVKSAQGGAGSYLASGPSAVHLSRISFGFTTTFALPGSKNTIALRSGVHPFYQYAEVISNTNVGIATIAMEHYLDVSVGAYHAERKALLGQRIARANDAFTGLDLKPDSELSLLFELSGGGSATVDEAIVLTATRAGPVDRLSAVMNGGADFLPLSVRVVYEP